MIQMTKPKPLQIAALVLLSACATIGDEAAFPGPVESGVGPFRPLNQAETALESTQAGRIVPAGPGVGRAMMTQGSLWYAAADALATPPERDDTLPDFEVDWAQFSARAIYASPSSAPTRYGYDPGAVVLEASEPWQGGVVFDPWAVEASDGSVRLYFASEGGIGVATRSAGGSFGAPTQILEDARAPSVVEFAGETLLFFERAGRIGLAKSNDGVNFSLETEALDVGERPPDDEEPEEVAQRSPGAVVVTSATGRVSLRVYFESRFDDLSSGISVAATMDTINYDRFAADLFGDATLLGSDPGQPAPFVESVGAPTLLTLTRTSPGRPQLRAILGAITPARIELVPSPEEP
ncbi:MAG: hypothetical protein ACI9KE_004326 [Polyangiales bacterium]|jgi:hypothetical protein